MSLSINNLNIKLNDVNLVKDLNIEVFSGELILLAGKSGSGKTTILSTLVGKNMNMEIESDISYFGSDFSTDIFIDKVSYIPQNYPLFDEVKVFENVEVTFKNSRNYFNICYDGFKDLEIDDKNFLKSAKKLVKNKKLKFNKESMLNEINFIFGKVGLSYDEIKDRKPTELSGGQRQRLSIACSLLKKPELIIMDEPFANLDKKTSELIMEFILDLKSEGISFIISSHDIDVIDGHEDDAILLSGNGDWAKAKMSVLRLNRDTEWIVSYFTPNYNEINERFYLYDEIKIADTKEGNKCKILKCKPWKEYYKVVSMINNTEISFFSNNSFEEGDEVYIYYE